MLKTAYGIGLRLRRRLGLGPERVFCIGFNKTGTTSLHELFQHLGYRSYHGLKWHDLAAPVYDRFECFSDGYPHAWKLLLDRYPRARFILNVRDCGSWILSRLRHIARAKAAGRSVGGGGWGPWDETVPAVEAWIRGWHDHHLEVLKTFEVDWRPLMVVNVVADPLSGQRVARFLGFPGRVERFHANPGTDEASPAHHTLVDTACSNLGIPRSTLAHDLLNPSFLDEPSYPLTSREYAERRTTRRSHP